MAIEVEKNIPMPTTSMRGRRGKYPFAGMAVGDSFFAAGVKTVQTARMGKALNMQFVARRDGEGVRVWRVA